jgi:hypothetical protein
VENEEMLHRVKEEINIVHTIKRKKADRIGHILLTNCLLKHVTERKIEERTEITEKTRKKLLDDLKDKRRYWSLEEEALDHTVWRTALT